MTSLYIKRFSPFTQLLWFAYHQMFYTAAAAEADLLQAQIAVIIHNSSFRWRHREALIFNTTNKTAHSS